jgi:cation:H+ antiporter
MVSGATKLKESEVQLCTMMFFLDGSNFFNTLAVVGVSGLVRPFSCNGGYVLLRDLWVMVILSLTIGLFGCSFSRCKVGVIGRTKGIVWILMFLAYFILLFVQEHKV